MKKYIIGSVIAFVGFAGVAFADCDAVTPCGNGDPMAVTQAWGLTGYQSLKIKSGETINTIYGLDTCPKWYPFGCMIHPKLVR